MKVSIREKCGSLYLDYRFQGKRRWEPLHLHLTGDTGADKQTRETAELARIEREHQLASGAWGFRDPVKGQMRVVQYAEEIASKMDKTHHLPKMIPYLRDFARGEYMSAIGDNFCKGFREYLLRAETINQTTASHYFAAFKHLLHIAVRDRVILRSPAEFVPGITEPEPEKVWLTHDEIERLQKTEPMGIYGAQLKRGFFFAMNTALRVSDVKSLSWGSIKRNPPQLMKRQNKTQTWVGVPLNAAAWAIIKDDKIHRPDELVFPRLSASETSANQYFRDWEEKAGIDHHIGWHTARHTFAVLQLEAGTDLYTVSKLMGHRSIKTTEVYAKASDPMKRAAVERFEVAATL